MTRPVLASSALAGALLLAACQPAPPASLAGVVGTSGGSPAATSSEEGPTRAVPSSIDASGKTDVTRQMQAFLWQLEAGETAVFPEGARYRVEGTLRMVDREGVAIAGNGAELFATTRGSRTRSMLRVERGTDIRIRDLKITGANPAAGVGEAAYKGALEAQHGFEILGVDGIVLDGVTVTDVYGDFIYIGGLNRRMSDNSLQFEWSRRVVVKSSVFSRNGRQGISVTAGDDVLIEDNSIGHTRRATFDIEPSGVRGGARNVRIVGNEVGAGRLNFVSIGGRGSNVSDITIADNELFRPFVLMARASDRSTRTNFVISGNVATNPFGSPHAAIELHGIAGARVEGNHIALQSARKMVAVRRVGSCDVVVAANEFPGAWREVEGPARAC